MKWISVEDKRPEKHVRVVVLVKVVVPFCCKMVMNEEKFEDVMAYPNGEQILCCFKDFGSHDASDESYGGWSIDEELREYREFLVNEESPYSPYEVIYWTPLPEDLSDVMYRSIYGDGD